MGWDGIRSQPSRRHLAVERLSSLERRSRFAKRSGPRAGVSGVIMASLTPGGGPRPAGEAGGGGTPLAVLTFGFCCGRVMR